MIHQPAKRKIRWVRVLFFLMICCLLLGAVGYGAYTAYSYLAVKPVVQTTTKDPQMEALQQRTNILLLGLDEVDNENPGSPRRSDTIMVLSINPTDKSVKLVSIPRDTRVMIPGYKGYDKVNHAYAYGGTMLATRTVETLLDMPIHYHVVIDWQAFIKVVDLLGGVDLYVEHDMDYEDPWANLKIHLKKGYQHLDGEQAGEYVRFRKDELGDIGRVQRQQKFMKAMSAQALQVGTILKLPDLVRTVNQYIQTDLNVLTMVKIVNSIKGINHGELVAEMVPGNFATMNGLSYWIPDKEQLKIMLTKNITVPVAQK